MIENKDKLNLPGQGLKSCFYEKEADLIYYFYELLKENIAVNSNLLIKKMYELKPDLKGKSFNAAQKLLYRLLKKNNITIRKATHIG